MTRLISLFLIAVLMCPSPSKAEDASPDGVTVDCRYLNARLSGISQAEDYVIQLRALNQELSELVVNVSRESGITSDRPVTLKCSNGVSAFRSVVTLLDGEAIHALEVFHQEARRFDDFFPTLMFPMSVYSSIDYPGSSLGARLSSISALIDLGASPIDFECQGNGCIICHSPIHSAVRKYRIESRKCRDSGTKDCPAVEAQRKIVELMLIDNDLLSQRVCDHTVAELLSNNNVELGGESVK